MDHMVDHMDYIESVVDMDYNKSAVVDTAAEMDLHYILTGYTAAVAVADNMGYNKVVADMDYTAPVVDIVVAVQA